MAEEKSRISTFEIVKGVATIMIPFVIAAVGWLLSEKHYQSEKQRQDMDRVRALFDELTDTNMKKRTLAITYMKHLANVGQIDQPFADDMAKIALQTEWDDTTRNSAVAKAVQENFPRVFAMSSSLAMKSPARVFIHIQDKNQREEAKHLETELDKAGFETPGIEEVKVFLKQSEIRFYRAEESNEADSLVTLLNGVLGGEHKFVKIDLSKSYARLVPTIRPRTYELWLRK